MPTSTGLLLLEYGQIHSDCQEVGGLLILKYEIFFQSTQIAG
jgi:hypothetical protein